MMDYDQQIQAAQLRQRDAMGRTQFQNPQGRMVSGIYVAPNPLEYLSAALRSAGAGREAMMAGQEVEQASNAKKQAVADALRTFGQMAQGTPAETLPEGQQGPTRPAQAPNMQGAYAALMQAPDAGLRQAGMQGMIQLPQIEAQAADRQAQREWQQLQFETQRQDRIKAAELAHQQHMEALQMQNASREQMAQAQREFQAQMAADNRQHQQSMANLQASLRPERNVTVLGPNGEAVTLPQSQAQGLPLYNPQLAAKLQKDKTKQQAKEQLSGVVQQLNNSYDALEKGGGAVSTGQGTLANIGARLSSSGIGQTLGGAIGTENQRHRQEIAQTRPLLLNLIKEATGMSAQQMNSNAEMQLYLQAATDPKLTVEANRSALANLDKMFGLGLAQRPTESGANDEPSGGMSAQDQQALQWANANPNDPRAAAIKQRLGAR